MTHQLNVALIGVGRMGKILLHALLTVPEINLVRICDENEERSRYAAALTAATPGTRISEVLADTAVDAVIISTPTTTHANLIKRAVLANKAVFVEKPLAHTLEAAEEVTRIVEQSGMPVQVGFQRRFDPGYLNAKRRIDNGELGEIEGFRAVGRDASPPALEFLRGSGGIFVDLGIHDLDSARFLVGEVSEVYATGGAVRSPTLAKHGLYDTAVATLRFVNGAFGTLELGLNSAWGYDIRTEILGSQGRISIEMDSAEHLKFYASGQVTQLRPADFEVRFAQAYRNELTAFAHNVLTGSPVNTSAQDALKTLRLALAAQQSLETGRVIQVKELQDLSLGCLKLPRQS